MSEQKKSYYRQVRDHLPAIPTRTEQGRTVLAVAKSIGKISNYMEIPQLYAVFPFGRYGLGLPGLELARDTWRHTPFNKDQKDYICWHQGGIFTARLGLTEEAKTYALKKFLHSGEPPRLLYPQWPLPCFPMRFPAFWNCFTFDHPPDMDHGGCAMVGLQEMLIQTPGRKILLLSAWPRDWDVDFKLHAPYQTTVEGTYRAGKLENLKITPASRAADAIDMSRSGG